MSVTSSTTPSAASPDPLAPPLEGGASGPRHRFSPEVVLRRVTGGVAVVPLVALIFVVVVLFIEAWGAIKFNGVQFFTTTEWKPGSLYGNVVTTNGVAHPVGVHYGALPLIVGTLQSSLIAVVIAIPVSVGAALALSDWVPAHLARPLGGFLELLAGIPSVIFGLWGAVTFGPILARDVYPIIANNAPDVPFFNWFRGPTGAGEGLLTSGLVLAIMIVPIIASTTLVLLRSVPPLPKEGASALGMNDWEVARRVSLPWIAPGIVGACILGLARAIGETMAVAMISGAVLGTYARNIYSTFTTIAATIVSQLDSALTDPSHFAVKTLAEAALVLVVIALLANIGARLLVKKTSGTALPVGRGV